MKGKDGRILELKRGKRHNNKLRETEKAKQVQLLERCEEIESLEKEGKMEKMCRRVKDLIFEKKSKAAELQVENEDRILVTGKEEVLSRWKVFTKQLYEERRKEL